MNNSIDELIHILRDTQALLKLPTNDFAWSSWEDADAATREIDGYIRQIEAGNYSSILKLRMLFAPTGQIQDVSISGWGNEFLLLAERFDQVIKFYS